MLDSKHYYTEKIKPNIQNKQLADIVDRLLSSYIYTAGYRIMSGMLESKTGDCRGCVSAGYKDGYVKTSVSKVFNVTAGSWSDTSPYSHDAQKGGLLKHSILTYQMAVGMWNVLDKILDATLKSQMLEAGYEEKRYDIWKRDIADTFLLGAYLHDIGKIAMVSPTFHKGRCRLVRMHEQYGYWILGLPWRDYLTAFTNVMTSGPQTYRIGMVLSLEMACVGHSGYYKDADGTMRENHGKYYAQKSLFVPYLIALADKMSASKSRGSSDYLDYRGEFWGLCSDLLRKEGRYTIENIGRQGIPSAFTSGETVNLDRFILKYKHKNSEFSVDLAW